MNQNTNTYMLDFVIPMGETGPIGPSSIVAMIFADYRNYNNNGIVPISTNTIIPNDSNVFAPTNDLITIMEDGVYEITFCGLLKDNSNIEAIIELNSEIQSNSVPIMSIVLLSELQQIYFSQTKVKECHINETISVFLRKPTSSNASVEMVTLIMKKINL